MSRRPSLFSFSGTEVPFDAQSTTSNDSRQSSGSLLRRAFATKKRDSVIDTALVQEQDLYFPPEIWQKIYCQLGPGAQSCLAATCRDMIRIVGRSSFQLLRTNQNERLHFLRRMNIATYVDKYFLCHNCGLFHELNKGKPMSPDKVKDVHELVSREFTSRRCVRSGGSMMLYPGYELSWWMLQLAMNMKRNASRRAVHLLEHKAPIKDSNWKAEVICKVYKGRLFACVKMTTPYTPTRGAPRSIHHCPHANPAKLYAALDNAWLACRAEGGGGRELSIGGISVSIGRRESFASVQAQRRDSYIPELPDRSRRGSAWATPQGLPEMNLRRGSTVSGLPDLSRPELRRGSTVTGVMEPARRGSVYAQRSPAGSRRQSVAVSIDPSPENPSRVYISTLYRCQHCPSEYRVEAQLISALEKSKYQVAIYRYIDFGEGLSPFEGYWPQHVNLNVPRNVLGQPFDIGQHRCVQARFDGVKGNTFVIALD